ncbi:hypothetical protein [Pantoea allii]
MSCWPGIMTATTVNHQPAGRRLFMIDPRVVAVSMPRSSGATSSGT